MHFSLWLIALARQAASLRGAVSGIAAARQNFYLASLKPLPLKPVSEAHFKRDAAMYRELFFLILERCRRNLRRKMRCALRIIDSTTNTFSDSRYGWAKYQSKSHGMKNYLMFIHENDLPHDLHVTHARAADVKIPNRFAFESRLTYVTDRGYADSKLR
ncbi:MAG: hypothetical protein OHK0011_20880 [Turneriella sp.]